MVGDGEAETGPLATSWHSNKLLNPAGDGAVLPILHLNGWKIANPTILSRISADELRALLAGYGHRAIVVEGSEPDDVHQQMAATMDEALDEITEIQRKAREGGGAERPAWPMIVLRHPEGLDRPGEVDGLPDGGDLPRPPGAPRRPGREARAPAHARGVDALRSYGPGAVRREGSPRSARSPTWPRPASSG